jgi:hypothetical protein
MGHQRRRGRSSSCDADRRTPVRAARSLLASVGTYIPSSSGDGNVYDCSWPNTAGGSVGTLTGVSGNGGESLGAEGKLADVGDACGERRRASAEIGVASSSALSAERRPRRRCEPARRSAAGRCGSDFARTGGTSAAVERTRRWPELRCTSSP